MALTGTSVSFIELTSDELNGYAVQPGQIIFVTDKRVIYHTTISGFRQLFSSDVSYVSTLPSSPLAEHLYVISSGDSRGLYIYVNNEWENLAADTLTADLIIDALGYTPVQGVKGNEESSYRTGNVNITKANIGLENVDNTADASKSVLSAAKLTTGRTFEISGGATAAAKTFTGEGNIDLVVTSLDATKLTGEIPIENIPPRALERLVRVADEEARFALSTDEVQIGDSVLQVDTGFMYFIIDDTKLSSEAGYQVYTAGTASSVSWAGVTDKPSSYTPSAHTHVIEDITDLEAAGSSLGLVKSGGDVTINNGIITVNNSTINPATIMSVSTTQPTNQLVNGLWFVVES